MFEECNDDGAGEDFKRLVSSLSPDSVEEVDYLFFSSPRLFELRMMKIFKVSKTDIAGKTLLQWLVEYDADVHIKILLDRRSTLFLKVVALLNKSLAETNLTRVKAAVLKHDSKMCR